MQLSGNRLVEGKVKDSSSSSCFLHPSPQISSPLSPLFYPLPPSALPLYKDWATLKKVPGSILDQLPQCWHILLLYCSEWQCNNYHIAQWCSLRTSFSISTNGFCGKHDIHMTHEDTNRGRYNNRQVSQTVCVGVCVLVWMGVACFGMKRKKKKKERK